MTIPDVDGFSSARARRPTPSARTVARRRVHRLLDEACEAPLTIVTAGPGWGKSTAVAEWVEFGRPRSPVVWLTLSPDDDNVPGFWASVKEAVWASGVLPDSHPLFQTSTAAGINDEVVSALRGALAQIQRPLVLVLDDFQVVEDRGVLDLIELIIDSHAPLRLVLLTRFEPLMALHRMRLEDRLVEVTAADLAFSADETTDLARAESLELSDDDLTTILTRTEGWPAGVRLAMLFLSRSGNLHGFAGTDRSVAEFLVAEVLERNSAQTKDFLLRTSLAHIVSSDLASAMVPQVSGQAILEMLERTNQFVTALGPDREWFRYHPLLREMLEHTYKRDDPVGYAQAQRVTARWLAVNGDPVDALGHAARAQDWSLFGDLFAYAAAPAVVGVRRPAICAQLRAVPYADQPPSSPLQLCIAALSLATGHMESMANHVRSAVELADGSSRDSTSDRALLTVMRAAAARHLGRFDDIAQAACEARAIIDACDPFPAADSYRAIAANNHGIAMLWIGEYGQAAASLDEVASIAPAADIEIARVTARSHLALCEFLRADLPAANTVARSVIEDADAKGWRSMYWMRPAFSALALENLQRGRLAEAEAALKSALNSNQAGREPAPGLLVRITQGYVAVSRRQIDVSRRSAEEVLRRVSGWDPPRPLMDEVVRLLTDVYLLTEDAVQWPRAALITDDSASATVLASDGRRLLKDGRPEQAIAMARRVADRSDTDTLADLLAVIEARITLASTLERGRHRYEALTALESAIDAARPRCIVRPFQIGDPALVPLLHTLQASHLGNDPFLGELLRCCDTASAAGTAPEPPLDPLTERELAVLIELPTMKSNAEIAGEFFVSVNTVKTHLKSIFRKLDVSTRREAVRRGREIGLLR